MQRYTRKLGLLITDALILNLALFGALFLRFEGYVPTEFLNIYLSYAIALTAGQLVIYYFMGLYRSLWKYASTDELIQVFFATVFGALYVVILCSVTRAYFPRSVYVISWFITFICVGGTRFSYRIMRWIKNRATNSGGGKTRVMVIGAGKAGAMVVRELKQTDTLNAVPVAIIDDDYKKKSSILNGVRVVGGRDKILYAAERYNVDEILIAMPSAGRRQMAQILEICKQTKCRLKTLPGMYELISGEVDIKQIRDVSLEDLLGRDEVMLDNQDISAYLTGETILVTGGGGSIGSELCRQIAGYNPKKLIILDIYENNAYELQNDLRRAYKKLDCEVLIGSVRDTARLEEIFATYRPGVVFHAAAHKHVPLMEVSPCEAVKNNVVGTLNTARAADKHAVKKFVLISTDKAVNPTNIMGASKRLCEMVVQSLDKTSSTEFAAVRFGNVLGSSGSVVPLFKKQISQGGPVTVTHPDVIRYFMTIPEASQLVIQAGALARGGEVFILDMGEPVKIADLARDLIRLSGFEPEVDIKIEYCGLRPGEKLYEELLTGEEGMTRTTHNKIYIAQPLNLSHNEVLMKVETLQNCINAGEEVHECMARVLDTFTSTDNEKIPANL